MYKVRLNIDYIYQNITRFEVWALDEDYFIFYFSESRNIVIKKEYVISIQKES